MDIVRCALCPGDHNCVGGDGPEDANILLLGEGPGPDEDRRGMPFCGRTGEEVNRHYLPLSGLTRPAIRVNNSMKCMPKGNSGRKMDMDRKADRELLQCCAAAHVYPDIARNHYKLILPVGAFACLALDSTIDLEKHHGFPIETPWGDAFPMYHPAGGIHEPKKMLTIRTDWIRLRKYLNGKLRVPRDEYIAPDYQEAATPDDLREYLGYVEEFNLPMACDTETTREMKPYCLTLSICPGTGRLIRAGNYETLDLFQEYLRTWKAPILFHNWLFDEGVVEDMGLIFPRKRIRDTMSMAFHLGNVPKGLKTLAYRLCGMEMEDFDDVVSPHSRPLVVLYYREAYMEKWPRPEMQLVRQDDGTYKEYRAQSMNTKLKRFFTDLMNDMEHKDVFSAWDNWEDSHAMIQEKLGPWPGKCITHVPFDKVLKYACRDADATLRVYPLLEAMRKQVRRRKQEDWGD
jgi:DNA polymerase